MEEFDVFARLSLAQIVKGPKKKNEEHQYL